MTNGVRNITEIKLAAALAASSYSNLKLEEIAELPLAAELRKSYKLNLTCNRTGLVVGVLHTITVAGYMPLLGQWKETQAFHPLFSLQPLALLKVARNGWHRFCALTAEETADSKIVEEQERFLSICALAILHNLTDVRQDAVWLPEWQDVVSSWQSILGLGYWRAYLDSDRFKFPSLRINKLNQAPDLKAFLHICWAKKKEYERAVISNIDEMKKQQAADLALTAIFDDLAGKRPRSIRYLWRWFENTMPSKYSKDVSGWMKEIFFATERDLIDFSVAEVDLFEEFFLSECEIGSTVSHAFLDVLRGKRDLLTNHYETYEIIIPDSIAAGVADGTIDAGKEPVSTDFPTRAKFIAARAKWKLAQPDFAKRQTQAREARSVVSIRHSIAPKLVIGADPDVFPEQEHDGDVEEYRREVSSGFGELE